MLAHSDLLLRFGINVFAVSALMFVMYYSRYKQKDTVIAATLFNIFAFAVLSVLSSAHFGVKVGFGLFAVLALFTLRSEPIKRIDISYFFGCLSIATLTSLKALPLDYVLLILGAVLLAVYVIDHPRILRRESHARVTLDAIPENVLSHPEALRDYVAERLGVKVLSVEVLSIDYVTEIVKADVNYRVE